MYASAQASRPKHKQEEPQTKGKGQVDWVWCKAEQPTATDAGGAAPYCTAELERDPYTREAMRLAHTPCAETNEWPSDHALEGYTLTVTKSPGE